MPRLTNLDVDGVSLVDRGAVRDPSNTNEPQRFLLFKRESGTNDPTKGGSMSEEHAAALEKTERERDEARERADKAEAEQAKLSERIEELEKAAKPEGDPEELNKADLSPAVLERLEKAETAEKAALAKAEEAEGIAKAERDLRIEREFVAKAEEKFPNVPGDTRELGKLLKSASVGLSKEEYEALETRLSAANEQIRVGSMFAELGKSGDGARGADENVDRMEKAAEEIRKSDPSLSEYEVLQRAMHQDREAQAAYLATNR